VTSTLLPLLTILLFLQVFLYIRLAICPIYSQLDTDYSDWPNSGFPTVFTAFYSKLTF
jgi:hypothetical protein